MLENEEVDDDYFTPIAKTSLASIFKKPFTEEITENETLKYTPPSPKTSQKQNDPKVKKTYEFIFSCVFEAYQWLENVYTHKGKLGCAVVKLTTEGCNFHSILLYDSKKATVSTTIATKDLNVTVNGTGALSYYDSYQKYWCLSGPEDDIQKITDILKTCNVNVNASKDDSLPQKSKIDSDHIEMDDKIKNDFESKGEFESVNTTKKNIGSDTDSSINRKTKTSILNRMANMGQSVLPPNTFPKEPTSYSSDSNESENDMVAIRPKPSIMKKPISEKNIFQQQRNVPKKSIVPRIHHSMEYKTSANVEDQLMPVNSSNIITSTSGNELSFFTTEQRIANSELRINMTRMSDKVDHILDKLNYLEVKEKEGSSNINTEILQKLLKEYESKIKTYEELFKNVDINPNITHQSTLTNTDNTNELIMLRSKIAELNVCIKQKDEEIRLLNKENKVLKGISNPQNKDGLLIRITELEREVSVKDEILSKYKAQNDELSKTTYADQLESTIKVIMNDTYHAAAANFDTTKTYTGEEIQTLIAAVIKKVTIEYLHSTK